MNRSIVPTSGLALLLSLLAQVPPAGAQPVTLTSGVYTSDQAERGRASYATNCLSCHAADLRGSSVSPTLRGVGFLFNWEGRSLAELYGTMADNMPTDRPGSLDRETYADLLAYILQVNGYPPGDAGLTPDNQLLEQLVIVPPG